MRSKPPARLTPYRVRFIAANESVRTHVHPVILDLHDVEGQWRGGFEIVHAIALHVNPKLIPLVKVYVEGRVHKLTFHSAVKNKARLSSAVVPRISQGDARTHEGRGVFILQVAEDVSPLNHTEELTANR